MSRAQQSVEHVAKAINATVEEVRTHSLNELTLRAVQLSETIGAAVAAKLLSPEEASTLLKERGVFKRQALVDQLDLTAALGRKGTGSMPTPKF